MAQFALSWDAYKQNICRGLTALQQNGEFVDMTIAADGHHVKVHQIIMSLVSPFIKDLITSAQCPHPIVFLNKVSYPTLCAILEYIYTGEVLVAKENLTELIDAARELKIKGLEEMKLELTPTDMISQATLAKHNQGRPLSNYTKSESTELAPDMTETTSETHHEVYLNDTALGDDTNYDDTMEMDQNDSSLIQTSQPEPVKGVDAHVQYTVSTHGSLQLILNRCLYYLRYTSRKGPSGQGHRQWRCVESTKNKCPATVITKEDVVYKRFGAHNHPFHDKQILKKVRDNAVYSAVTEAEALGNTMKNTMKDTKKDHQKDNAE